MWIGRDVEEDRRELCRKASIETGCGDPSWRHTSSEGVEGRSNSRPTAWFPSRKSRRLLCVRCRLMSVEDWKRSSSMGEVRSTTVLNTVVAHAISGSLRDTTRPGTALLFWGRGGVARSAGPLRSCQSSQSLTRTQRPRRFVGAVRSSVGAIKAECM